MGLRAAFVDLVLGGACASCGSPGPAVCDPCTEVLRATTPFTAWPDPVPAGLPAPTATAPYDGVVRKVILEHKENGNYALARPLGLALARAVQASLGEALARAGLGEQRVAWLCPVPSAPATVRRRGHDPLRRLVVAGVKELRRQGCDVRLADALAVVRRPADQAGLSAGDRAANLAGAFAARSRWAERLTDQTILLVDDVLTTGSTLTEAARALSVRGIAVHGCAVVAATPRRPVSRS